MKRLIIGTRASKLAMIQTQWVVERLKEQDPALPIVIEPIRTTGDALTHVPLTTIGGDGVFVQEIERALLEKRIGLRETPLPRGALPAWNVSFLKDLWSVFTLRDFDLVFVARIFIFMAYESTTIYTLFFLQDAVHVQSPTQAVTIFQAVVVGCLFVTSLLTGGHSDKIQRRKPFVIVGSLVMAVALLLLALFPTWGMVLVAAAADSSYATWWQAQSPCQQWIAYNLDGAGSLGKVLVVWYDDQTPPYDYTLVPGYRPIGLPGDYTLETSAQGNLDRPPATGWTPVVAVRGNTYHSRQHLIDMTGRHWLRMSIRTALGGPGATLHLDVYALHADPPLSGDFLFLGDSITQGPALQLPQSGVVSIPQLIARKVAGSLPVEEDGGIQDITPGSSVAHLGTWLNLFPGKYVALNYGTNAALHGCMSQSTVFGYFTTLVQQVLARGLIPIIPHILWGAFPRIGRCGPAVNAAIDQIYAAYPHVLRGPDFWEIFWHHPGWLHDGIHPNAIGIGVYRQHYATLLCAEVYQTVC